MAARFPGWVASENHLEYALIEEGARLNGETMQVAADVSEAIFDGFGSKLVGIPRDLGTPATAQVTVTAIDNAGYTLPRGHVVAYRLAGDVLQLFELTADAAIPAGSLAVPAVPIASQEVGAEFNAIAAGSAFESMEAVSWLSSIVSDTATAGGTDEETTEAYLDRLSDAFTTFADRPILPEDFEVISRNVAGVHRALALDGYDPNTLTYNNERTVSVAAVDSLGNALSAAIEADLDTYLQDRREVNFLVYVIDPTYTTIAVDFAGVALPGFDAATVQAAAIQNVTDYLNPASWGGGDLSPPVWTLEDRVRFQDVVTILNNTLGLAYYTTLTINGAGADVLLAGPAPLPRRVEAGGSTVTGAVSAP